MNEARLIGKREQIRGRAKERWGTLTNNDLAVIQGREEQFIGKLQEIYSISKEDARKQLRAFFKPASQPQRVQRRRR
jgi:uncharacterized protein YjbJ (UPF0337 family)